MGQINSISEARAIMLEYADITGLSSGGPPRRYLWTDAFAVCNLLELYHRTGEEEWRNLALQLVDQVHHILGRHRGDDTRSGWISGLNEAEGELHPTRGGLRIGKKLNERKPEELPHERLEWEQDGQYFHYLTKWMHALNRVSRVTGNPVYLTWAIQLAQSAHAAFVSTRNGARRMYWKMSIDLSRPLVLSMGQHDPLDGYVTFGELQAAALEFRLEQGLSDEIADFAGICRGREWDTDDSLGIGGLLGDSWRMAQLTDKGIYNDRQLMESMISAALAGLGSYSKSKPLKTPARYRLAFRELGLSIGLKGVAPLRSWSEKNQHSASAGSLHQKMEALSAYLPLGDEIETFWLEKDNRRDKTWGEHREINLVMLATRLASDVFLSI